MASDKIFTNGAMLDIQASAFLTKTLAQKQNYLTATRNPHPSLVAVVPTGAMKRDTLYASGKTDNAPFYLPRFDLRREPNVPEISLKRLATGGDPTKPQGRLTIEVDQLGWIEPRVKCFPVDLDLSGVLRFDIPLEDDLAFDHADHKNYDGGFTAYDPQRQGLTELGCSLGGNMSMKVSPIFRFGKALWKPDFAFGRVRDGAAVIYCTSAERQIVLHLRAISSTAMHIEEHVVEQKNSWSSRHLFQRGGRQFDRTERSFELAPFEVVDEHRRRSVTDIWSSADYVRLWQIATVPDHNTRLDLHARVLVARKHVDKTFVGPKVFEKIKKDMPVISVDRQLREIRPDAGVNAAAVTKFLELLKATPKAEAVRRDAPTRVIRHAEPPVVRDIQLSNPDIGRFADARFMRVIEGLRVEAPTVMRGVREHIAAIDTGRREEAAIRVARDAAMAASVFDASQFLVPVERDGTPKLSFRHEVSVQSIAPFSFDPDWFKGKLEPPEDADTPLRLIRHNLQAGSRRATFYQDALEPNSITYEPESFELARADEAPFEPLLLFFLEETENEAGGDPTFSVTLTFQARPIIHPDLLAQARAEFGSDADIRAIMPTVSKLHLMMPASAAGATQPLEIDGTEIELTDGLIASVELNEMQYHQVIAGFQTAGGTGLAGHIEVTLTDGTVMQIPVDLSVKDAIGPALRSRIAEVDGNDVTVEWHNQIESPIRVLSMPAVQHTTGRLEPTAALPASPIPSGGLITSSYRLAQGATDPDAEVLPEYTVEPDMLAVLSQTTVVQGYDDDRFTITCRADRMFFDFAPSGMAPLSALELTFRTLDAPVVLTRSALLQTVELTMPKLLFLTSADAAQHYSVSITNVHEDGTRLTGPFRPGQGDLTVEPVSGMV